MKSIRSARLAEAKLSQIDAQLSLRRFHLLQTLGLGAVGVGATYGGGRVDAETSRRRVVLDHGTVPAFVRVGRELESEVGLVEAVDERVGVLDGAQLHQANRHAEARIRRCDQLVHVVDGELDGELARRRAHVVRAPIELAHAIVHREADVST